ncbi:unnamed protein product [Dovyalis caffra]|uniref:Uncharacterized protein n=1 Tax=Dovyalis caffra TaxID=77055 RepID=A0AAV1RUS7_9ROSI|nr:unnamed protein product [Dovyalis caffra]
MAFGHGHARIIKLVIWSKERGTEQLQVQLQISQGDSSDQFRSDQTHFITTASQLQAHDDIIAQLS